MSETGYRHLVRVASTDIRGDKPLKIALTYIKGVNQRLAIAVLRALGIDENQKLGYIPDAQIEKIEKALYDPVSVGLPWWLVNRPRDPQTGENRHLLGSDLLLQRRQDIEAMIRMRSWRGIRHSRGLKVRGQRTKSNGRRGLALGVSRKKR